MKKSIVRFTIILITAFLLGLIYNQLHPNGIKSKLLFHSSFLTEKDFSNTVQIISADSAFVFFEKPSVKFLDIRVREDYQLDHIPGADHIAFNHLLNGSTAGISIRPGDKVIIYDQEGKMEQLGLAATSLRQAGYTDLFILFGGYLSWLEKGFIIESGEGQDE